MASELITSWNDYQSAIDRLLPLASSYILIYDEDLAQLRLDSPQRLEQLAHLLQSGGHNPRLKIAVRNSRPLLQEHPRLGKLLDTYSHLCAAQQTPLSLAHLRDAMIIIDGKHGLIRFEKDMPRSKLLIDESEALKAYCLRFEEIWEAGASNLSATTLGL